jgi:hypothetical protein
MPSLLHHFSGSTKTLNRARYCSMLAINNQRASTILRFKPMLVENEVNQNTQSEIQRTRILRICTVAVRVPHHHEVITKVYTFRLLSFFLVCPKSAAHAASGKWVPGREPEHCLEAGWKGSKNQVYKATGSRTLEVGSHRQQ